MHPSSRLTRWSERPFHEGKLFANQVGRTRMSMGLGRLRLALLCLRVHLRSWLGECRVRRPGLTFPGIAVITRNNACLTVGHQTFTDLFRRIGEKFLEWTDTDPALDDVLESVTLYWLTDTFPRCIYPYRAVSHTASKHHWFPYVIQIHYTFADRCLLCVACSAGATTCLLY